MQVRTLGCARNEVDAEELAGRLAADGMDVRPDGDGPADVVVVATCGFVDQAAADSVEALLDAAGTGAHVVAAGCLAERHGRDLAAALPEAAAVWSFDDYADAPQRVRDVLDGVVHEAHVPRDRRTLLPLAPADRPAAVDAGPALPGHVTGAGGSAVMRRRLRSGPSAPLKIASGCDRRCAFCSIPSFRGSFASRPAADVVAEAHHLVAEGVREVVLVSENSTSWGKDLPRSGGLARLVRDVARVDGLHRVRATYLQPAEVRPELLDALLSTDRVAPYLDLSFQHASGPVLRRMRRFGDAERFLGLLDDARRRAPRLGARSSVLLGHPGETDDDVEVLLDFLREARLDAVGVFAFSPQDGTEAATLDGAVDPEEVADRARRVQDLVDHLMDERAESRLGEDVEVLVESVEPVGDAAAGGWAASGRAGHQAPDVDGLTTVRGQGPSPATGELLEARVVGTDGVDLLARAG